MPTIKLDPSAIAILMRQANDAGIPHSWVQINSYCAPTVLSWERDGNESGLRITLGSTGTWSAELDLP